MNGQVNERNPAEYSGHAAPATDQHSVNPSLIHKYKKNAWMLVYK